MVSTKQGAHVRTHVSWLVSVLLLLFGVSFFRTASVTEDAFIIFRLVENVVSGMG